MQIILPLLFVYYFVSHRKIFGTQISLVWLGQNLMNISVYVTDAKERSLPLLGGNKVYHDWHFLLGRTGLLEYDNEIGLGFYLIGILIYMAALLMSIILKENKEFNLELNL